MPRRASILGGPYGDGTYGLKCSRPGYDVLDLAGDNDIVKRSYNSQWTGLAKIKILGAGLADWRQWQEHGDQSISRWAWARSGWRRDQSWISVPTGLTYMPIWESRPFNPTTNTFLDDYANVSFYSDYGFTTTSGGRVRFPSPLSGSTTNTLLFSPWEDYTNRPVSGVSSTYAGIGHNVYNENTNGFIGVYPEYPAMPSDDLGVAYVIYRNKLGDAS